MLLSIILSILWKTFDELNIELLKVKGIISGSTMLQCFYGNSKLYLYIIELIRI